MCPADHPFIPVAQLEAEAGRLIEAVVTTLFTNPCVMAICLGRA